MRRLPLLLLPVVLCLIVLPVVAAEVHSPRTSSKELSALELQLHSMLGQLTHLEDARPAFRRHPNDLYSLTVRLSESQRRGLSKGLAGAKDPQLLAVGQQRSIPNRLGFVSNPVLVDSRSVLNFWWALYNPTAADFVSGTRLTVKGAGSTFLSQVEDLTYEAGAITLYWEGKNVALESPGVYTHRVRVSGAGSRKTQFLVE